MLSSLEQANLDGASFGPYYCTITDSYITGMVMAHKEEIQDILDTYNLSAYESEDTFWDEGDIYNGEKVNMMATAIYLEFYAGDTESNLKKLKDVAAAGAAIDNLLALSYDMNYEEKALKKGINYEQSSNYNGMSIDFEWQTIGYDGEYHKTCDVASFNYSTSDEERWTEEDLFQYMHDQMTRLFPEG